MNEPIAPETEILRGKLEALRDAANAVSMALHAAEAAGIDLPDQLDSAWLELTDVLQRNGA